VAAAAETAAKLSWYAMAVLLAIGVVEIFIRRRLRRARDALVALVIANWVCFTVVFWGMPRYRYAIEPVLMIVAACGITGVVEAVARRARGARDSVVHMK
jgi:hypothetical protein